MTTRRFGSEFPNPESRIPNPEEGDIELTSTYRVQLNAAFTLRDAIAIVEYLHQLGISHLYCSPILRARKGSMHGYDVADPSQVNPEIGTLDDLRALAEELHGRGMGMLVDIVPNHMGVGPDNPYWEDVLTHGMQSRYAHWFDIDWDAGGGHHRVVLPVLDDELEAIMERGEIALDVSGRTPRLRHGEGSWPVDPATLTEVLEIAQLDPTALEDPSELLRGTEGRARLRALLDAQHYRLTFWRHGPAEINYRRFFDVNDLIGLRQEDPRVFAETHGFILDLVHEGIIDGLRVDHVDGLADPLAYLIQLSIGTRDRTGLRDSGFSSRGSGFGIRDSGIRKEPIADNPLRVRAPESRGPNPESRMRIVIEKILSPGEQLRRDWPIQGTTGYEFLNELEDVFLDAAGFQAIERGYRDLRRMGKGGGGKGPDFADIAHQGKVRVLEGALQADVGRLARLLAPLLPDVAGTAAAGLQGAIVQYIAALPVYRTYIDGRTPEPAPEDAAIIDRTLQIARARLAGNGAPVLPLVERIADLLRRTPAEGSADHTRWLAFVQRLQQTSGAATAKGIEDTALYQYVPLVSRNEVGGAPDRPLADAVERLHRANAGRQHCWPVSLICTNTHDTKRSADLRSRLDVLTECPPDWHRQVRRWRRLNQRHRRVVRGRLAPDTNTEYLLYQTLLGVWPAPRAGRRSDDVPDREWRSAARERINKYMRKAVREAKLRTSWTDPDAAYEDALAAFVTAVLEPGEDAPFLTDVARFVAQIAPRGHWNALSRMLVQLTAPGTPDIYRGDELWFFALVDPDNRQPVDYDLRRRALADVVQGNAGLHAADGRGVDPADPRLKLRVLHRILAARRNAPALFTRGAYLPLEVHGPAARHVVAFARLHEGHVAVSVATRLLGLMGDAGSRAPGEGEGEGEGEAADGWGDTFVVLPAEINPECWRSVVDGRQISRAPGPEGARALWARELFATLPLALLLSP